MSKHKSRKAKAVKAWAIVKQNGEFVKNNFGGIALYDCEYEASQEEHFNERIARVEIREIK